MKEIVLPRLERWENGRTLRAKTGVGFMTIKSPGTIRRRALLIPPPKDSKDLKIQELEKEVERLKKELDTAQTNGFKEGWSEGYSKGYRDQNDDKAQSSNWD